MNVIIGTAGSGKTKDLIKKAIDEKLPILEINPLRAKKLRERAMTWFGESIEIFDLETIGDYSGQILVDDIDKAFSLLVDMIHGNKVRVNAATVTIKD